MRCSISSVLRWITIIRDSSLCSVGYRAIRSGGNSYLNFDSFILLYLLFTFYTCLLRKASISSTERHLSNVTPPIRVRSSAIRCAPDCRAMPMSRAKARM
ncbi:hypothetical protein Barb4_03634 [Bacteroidales bacterium Barb4]|nr:hypothetical protein Barb4_03634 [Bacteroidales bacterium Barb4]